MISPLAYIHPEAKIGENVEIGPFVFIDKNVIVPPHSRIGFNHEEDIKRGFHVSPNGVTVVPKGAKL